MEQGFYHPTLGYWQTVSTPSDDIIASYQKGTVEVPLKPSANCFWDGSQWIPVEPTPLTPEQLSSMRAEAYRAEADPIFFKAQRGEATEQDWLDKVEEIKLRYTYHTE